MEKSWSSLYKEAKSKINVQSILPFIESGNISCAILSGNNNIYTGVNISTNTSLSSSAERNAISLLLNNGEKTIKKIVILNELEELIKPSEDCLEYLYELCEDIDETEVLIDYEQKESLTIRELIPNWWGTYRNKKN
jgi:cytidine deaminase